MDQVLDYNNYDILKNVFSDKTLRQNIRLLVVFGCGAGEAIYVTNEDKVYCFGRNRCGGLGLGTVDEQISNPTHNTVLSGKQIDNIFCGFEHWIAKTRTGRCYSWGNNTCGQLGIGSVVSTQTPQLIKELKNTRIVDISCGGFHTLALTSDGQVYGWGHNEFGQIGDSTFTNGLLPKIIDFDEKIQSVSCGKKHSMALTVTGLALVWGLNSYGQLGREYRNSVYVNRPKPIPDFEDMVFAKALCGPNHTLLLSDDGYVYAFGENTCGQIGNGSNGHQYSPFKVFEDIRFKDIIGHKENDISIAVSIDNRVFVWGLVKNRRFLTPKEITSGDSVFDIYAKSVKKAVTFKAVIIDSELNTWELINKDFEQQTTDRKDLKTDETISTSYEKRVETNVRPLNRKLNQNERTVDQFLDIEEFNYRDLNQLDLKTIRSIRLFSVYQRGNSVIFVTKDDKVFGLGFNRNGGLGCDSKVENIHKPELNTTLSGKQLVDIACGFEHCIGLTSSGECYGWGLNRYGQLGIGSDETPEKPQKIEEFYDKTIVQISCGAYHSMAVSSDGELFSWGHNTFAQLGDKTYNSRNIPTQVLIRDHIRSVSCGLNHSIAVSFEGQVYVWGGNEFGQLGRHKSHDVRENRQKPVCNRPHKLLAFDGVVVTKAVCGPNHSLLLTSDGSVFVFGDNSNGQIGNGTTETQWTPHLLNKKLKIKDIVCNRVNEMSLAVTEDNKVFAWGLVHNKNVLKPQLLPPKYGKSLFDIYVKLAKEKVTYKTLCTDEDAIDFNEITNNWVNNEVIPDLNESVDTLDHNSYENEDIYSDNGSVDENGEQSDGTDDQLIDSFAEEFASNSGEEFLKHLKQSFNNPNNCDLKICCEGKVIYCHKTIFQIRNDSFWQILNRKLIDQNNNEIQINPKTYESFYAFIQYMYGMTPEISVEFITDLQKMAKHFGEPQLEDMCGNYCRQLRDCINVANVCAFYEMAINRGLTDLETDCIEFVSKNTKNVFKSEAFVIMDDSLSKRLMNAIINQNN